MPAGRMIGMMRRLVPLLLLVTACSPAVTFRGTVTVDGVDAPDPARLRISLSTEPGIPPVDPQSAERTLDVVLDDAQKLTWGVTVFGSRAALSAWLWYDTDGDGVREPGEPEGQFTGFVGRDRGIFSGNTTEVPEMALAAVVPLAERHPDDQPK